MQILRAVFCSLVLCALYGVAMTSAQNITSLAWTGATTQNVYIYNPASDTIVGPSGSGLAMYPYQEYNSSMLWTVTTDSAGLAYIYAASSQTEGCASGTNAFWSAARLLPVTTACSSSSTTPTAVGNSFYINPSTVGTNTYLIIPTASVLYCVTVVTNVPTIPSTACNHSGKYVQWQLVTISP